MKKLVFCFRKFLDEFGGVVVPALVEDEANQCKDKND